MTLFDLLPSKFEIPEEAISEAKSLGLCVTQVGDKAVFMRDSIVLMKMGLPEGVWIDVNTEVPVHLKNAVQAAFHTSLAMIKGPGSLVAASVAAALASHSTKTSKVATTSSMPKAKPVKAADSVAEAIEKLTVQQVTDDLKEVHGMKKATKLASEVEVEGGPVPSYQLKLKTVDAGASMGIPVVKLSEAKALYLPTRGTGPATVYFVVGFSEKVSVAARYQANTLSIRVEGDLFSVKKALVEAGFVFSQSSVVSQAYLSMHLTADLSLAKRALGAVLAPFQFKTPMVDLELIHGKGA